VECTYILRINTQRLLKGFGRFLKAQRRAICDTQVYISREVVWIQRSSLFISTNRFGVTTHCAIDISDGNVSVSVVWIQLHSSLSFGESLIALSNSHESNAELKMRDCQVRLELNHATQYFGGFSESSSAD